MAIGQGGQGHQRQVEYRSESRQSPQEEFRQNMQSNYGIQPRFPERHGAHYVSNIGQRIDASGQRTDAEALGTENDMDTSEDVSLNTGSPL